MKRSRQSAAAALLAAIVTGQGLFPIALAAADEKKAEKEAEATPTLTLPVGKRYRIFMADRSEWPRENSAVIIEKNYADGWVRVKTSEGQTAWINLKRAMQIVEVEQKEK